MSEFEKELLNKVGPHDRTHNGNELFLGGVLAEHFKDWQPPKQLVVVPQIIADWIELIKQINRNVLTLLDSDDMPCDVYDWLFIQEDDENINLIILAWLDGYTVEKEKLYYLREKNTGYYLTEKGDTLKLVVNPYFDETNEFAQEEIDKLNIGSYEQIPVEMSDNGI